MQDLQEDPTLGRIGGFRLIKRLATGGTSDVLLARAEGPHGFERTVVLKRLLSEHQEDPEFARMFTREASAYSRLSHPAIVRLFDFFTAQRQLIMVLEYIDGVSLARLMQATIGSGRTLDDRAALFVASRVFDALAAAHAARDPETGDFAAVIHRDINPSNVLIPWDGHVKLADFGIAKIVGTEGDTKTGVGGIKGTYGYMAPEQVTGDRVTVRTDVYAASLVLWELLAHKKAIQSDKLPEMEILRAMAEPNIPSLEALRPDLSPVLREAVARGLEPNARNRTISAEEMVSVLREHMTSLDDARNALVASLGPLRRGATGTSIPDIPMSDTATAPHLTAAVLAEAQRLDDEAHTRAVPSAEMMGILGQNVPPDAPTRPQLMGAAAALQAVEEPLRRMTPSGLRAVPAPAFVPSTSRPPARPSVSSQVRQDTLSGDHGSTPSNPDLAGAIGRVPVPIELSAQHLVAEDSGLIDLRPAPPLPPSAPPTPHMHMHPMSPLIKTAVMNAAPHAPPQMPPPSYDPHAAPPMVAAQAPQFQPQFAPFAPPFVSEPPAQKKSAAGFVLLALGGLLVVALLAAAAYVKFVMATPVVTVTKVSPTVAPSTKPALTPIVSTSATSHPQASASTSASAPSGVASAAPTASVSKPLPSATPIATANPSVTPVDSNSASAAPGVDSAHGLIQLPSWSVGRRVWIDGKLAGEGPDPKIAVCGAREVKIGSSGEEKLVNVPCGGEVDLAH